MNAAIAAWVGLIAGRFGSATVKGDAGAALEPAAAADSKGFGLVEKGSFMVLVESGVENGKGNSRSFDRRILGAFKITRNYKARFIL